MLTAPEPQTSVEMLLERQLSYGCIFLKGLSISISKWSWFMGIDEKTRKGK
jgi:hypothetical protein